MWVHSEPMEGCGNLSAPRGRLSSCYQKIRIFCIQNPLSFSLCLNTLSQIYTLSKTFLKRQDWGFCYTRWLCQIRQDGDIQHIFTEISVVSRATTLEFKVQSFTSLLHLSRLVLNGLAEDKVVIGWIFYMVQHDLSKRQIFKRQGLDLNCKTC